jgi:hypothetical protein
MQAEFVEQDHRQQIAASETARNGENPRQASMQRRADRWLPFEVLVSDPKLDPGKGWVISVRCDSVGVAKL